MAANQRGSILIGDELLEIERCTIERTERHLALDLHAVGPRHITICLEWPEWGPERALETSLLLGRIRELESALENQRYSK